MIHLHAHRLLHGPGLVRRVVLAEHQRVDRPQPEHVQEIPGEGVVKIMSWTRTMMAMEPIMMELTVMVVVAADQEAEETQEASRD